ncbi:hypothetical protein [Streptomyces chartreusis]|uniref:Uncharacterized protein n=1 Tax=Streptomyces chartreusis TaxID=1969 RepID=A0A7H8TC55_STRCX|nr:hypothetical protein [Streptomyces chartreusis]QKZ21083.1 hypothetical protein HUT05_29340 [Streptomyces chartreusis]
MVSEIAEAGGGRAIGLRSCRVVDCARPRWRRHAMCSVHAGHWQEAEARGMSRAQFLRTAEPLLAAEMAEAVMCRICPERPAFSCSWCCASGTATGG